MCKGKKLETNKYYGRIVKTRNIENQNERKKKTKHHGCPTLFSSRLFWISTYCCLSLSYDAPNVKKLSHEQIKYHYTEEYLALEAAEKFNIQKKKIC